MRGQAIDDAMTAARAFAARRRADQQLGVVFFSRDNSVALAPDDRRGDDRRRARRAAAAVDAGRDFTTPRCPRSTCSRLQGWAPGAWSCSPTGRTTAARSPRRPRRRRRTKAQGAHLHRRPQVVCQLRLHDAARARRQRGRVPGGAALHGPRRHLRRPRPSLRQRVPGLVSLWRAARHSRGRGCVGGRDPRHRSRRVRDAAVHAGAPARTRADTSGWRSPTALVGGRADHRAAARGRDVRPDRAATAQRHVPHRSRSSRQATPTSRFVRMSPPCPRWYRRIARLQRLELVERLQARRRARRASGSLRSGSRSWS